MWWDGPVHADALHMACEGHAALETKKDLIVLHVSLAPSRDWTCPAAMWTVERARSSVAKAARAGKATAASTSHRPTPILSTLNYQPASDLALSWLDPHLSMDQFDSLLDDGNDELFSRLPDPSPSTSVIPHNPNRRLLGTDAEAHAYVDNGFGNFADFVKHKRIKLHNQRLEDVRDTVGELDREVVNKQMFKGLAVYINGLTTSAGIGQQQLSKAITLHGGTLVRESQHFAHLDNNPLTPPSPSPLSIPRPQVNGHSHRRFDPHTIQAQRVL